MTNEQEIEQQITADYEKFRHEVYKGKIAPPDSLIHWFKWAAMVLSPQGHKLSAYTQMVIASKHVSELSNGDVNDIVMLVINTPPEHIWNTFEAAVEGQIKLQKFIIGYNEHIEDFRKKLEMKKATLKSLVNGMPNKAKIIPMSNGQA